MDEVSLTESPTLVGEKHARIVEITDEYGECSVVYEILNAPSLEAARAWADEERPARRCTHEYDCCGRSYPSPADVVEVSEHRYLISQSWHLNV